MENETDLMGTNKTTVSALKEGKELKAIFSALVEAIVVLDRKLNIREINTAALKLFGVSEESALGSLFSDVTGNGDLTAMAEMTLTLKQPMERKLLLREKIPSEDRYGNYKFTSRGLYFQVNTSFLAIDEKDIRIILVLHDITQIETLERIRKDFVANVSHELKTPVTSILGFVETLLNGAIDNKRDAREFLEIVHSQSLRLDAIIKDLLSLSSLEAYENTEVEVERLLFSDIVSAVLKNCSAKIDKKGILVKRLFPENLYISANSFLLEQALVNLVDNSVKYCPPESTIIIKGESFSDYTLITISDNGPGIPEKDIPRVFERFYTVDKARSREMGGTGLGLAIVKHIILAHKGQIHINSKIGDGTKFVIRLPLLPFPNH